ncbi:MAG: hypothetical protein IKA76_05995 [Clostridia bacterium]|nr:hypothetical protein [Clostridia bacterium]
MYARQPLDRRSPPPLRIPKNYSGNAFPPKEEPPPPEEIRSESPPEPPKTEERIQKEDLPVSKPTLAGFFGKGDRSFGIGSEELLILGLILLISKGDSHDDLLPLLLLLLLMG